MILYSDSLSGVGVNQLNGLCVGWKSPLNGEQLHQVLAASAYINLAVDSDDGRVIGFINAISDCIMSAYIPMLEVRPDYQGRGVGTRLVQEMLKQTEHLHMVDLICDPPLQPFYQRLGMHSATGMLLRRRHPHRF